MRSFILVFLSVVFFSMTLFVVSVEAESLSGVAYRVVVEGVDRVDSGVLISLVNGKYQLASISNETNLVGVINLSPQIEIDTIGSVESVPLVKSGLAYVRVSNKDGNIKKGSSLGISDVPGVASLAKTTQLTLLGQALEDFDEVDGLIKVDINIRSNPGFVTNSDGLKVRDVARESFFELFKVFRNASQVPAPQAFKFVLAGLILFAAVIFGFFTFGRVAQRGVEAIGRNPLAKNTILVGLIINVIISVAVIFSGLLAAYYIIRL